LGKPSRTIVKFIDSLTKIDLNAKWIAVFDTYYVKKSNFEKTMKKMEKDVDVKLPNLKLIAPGL
jgi:hypothetical protein